MHNGCYVKCATGETWRAAQHLAAASLGELYPEPGAVGQQQGLKNFVSFPSSRGSPSLGWGSTKRQGARNHMSKTTTHHDDGSKTERWDDGSMQVTNSEGHVTDSTHIERHFDIGSGEFESDLVTRNNNGEEISRRLR